MGYALNQPFVTTLNDRWPWQVPVPMDALAAGGGAAIGMSEGAAEHRGAAIIKGVTHALVRFDDRSGAERFAARMRSAVYDMRLPKPVRGW